ncbi:MAG: 4a-hydroxytetrahydrobiopterin dehydratase [Myxococcales bacterium]|nr:4a-hydroxytetrahydrobiopterin dehydratase [Myxococcales bacterium]MCB9713946.1 4a-hydroxytetrahydrobiopterin dehydratase [Myxococcales bacterium]
MPRALLSEAELTAGLADLPGWTVADGKLHRAYRFDDFVTAFGFMAQVAIEAERLDHHPNWSNVYDRVEVTLWTHDAGGLTELDLRLARAMERRAGLAGRRG